MTRKLLRQVAPAFFPVPAGVMPTNCPACGEPIYLADTLAPGKLAEVDCAVLGGRAPTATNTGSGVLHRIYCNAPARTAIALSSRGAR